MERTSQLTDILRTWVRLRMACGETWSGEWANGESRGADWLFLCGERAPIWLLFECVSGSCRRCERHPLTRTFDNTSRSIIFFKTFCKFFLTIKKSMLNKCRNIKMSWNVVLNICIAYIIRFEWCVFFVHALICKCVFDVGGTGWRHWGRECLMCANVEWCVSWLPVAFVVWGAKDNVSKKKWREFLK